MQSSLIRRYSTSPRNMMSIAMPKKTRVVVARFEFQDFSGAGSMRELAFARIIEDIQLKMKEKKGACPDVGVCREVLDLLQRGEEKDESDALHEMVFELYGSGATLEDMIRILDVQLHHPPGSSMSDTKRAALIQQTMDRRGEIEKLCALCTGTHGGCTVLDLQSALEKQLNISLSDEDMRAMMEALEGGDLCFDCPAEDCSAIISTIVDSLTIPSLEDTKSDAHFYHALTQHKGRV